MAYNIEDFPIETASPQIEVILPVGRHVLELVVEDSAGLRSAPDTVVITVEREAVPEITGIKPDSGQPGSAFEAVITGKNLLGATEVEFTGSGVTAEIRPGGTAEKLPVRIQIDSRAAAGARRFTVTTPGGRAESGDVVFRVAEVGPTVTGPTVTRPTVTRPTLTVPTATVPTVTRPTITIPTVTMPTGTVPTVTRPTVMTPTITRPTLTIPTVTRPTGTVPIITRPTVPQGAGESLTEIRGIGPVTEGKLHAAGIRSVADLASASPERVAEVIGTRDIDSAVRLIEDAKRLIR